MTPIEELQEAVERYVARVSEDNDAPIVSAFVLEYEVTSFVDEDGVEPRETLHDYATGSGTTLATAVGLARALQRTLDRAMDDSGLLE